MSQLVDLQERFRRLQERDLSALSPDARKITLEEATSLRKKLTETQWGTHEVTGAVSLTADVASFCRDVKDSGITESDSEKFIVLVNGEKVHGPCSRKEAMEFVDKENKAQQAKNDYVEIRVEPVAELQLSSRWEATDDDEDDESTEPVEESEDRSQAVRDHGTGKKRLKVGDRVGDSTVTDVNDQTVSFKTDDGYSSSIQIPFVDNGDTMTLSGAIAYGKYSRPTKAEAVVEALTSLYPISLDADIVEATAGARAAYRSAFKIEGPLTQEETRGVARYVSSGPRVGTAQVGVRGTLKAAKAFKKLPSQISEAIVEKKSASHVVIEAKTSQERASIEEALLKYSSPVLLVWDEREQIVQECAQRYAPLLEAQTLKTLSESARTAGSQAEITELSAKNQASRQVLHVLARRARLAEDRIVVLGDRLEAAQSLAEALVQELSAERLRGAVEGIAATQKDPKVVSEVAQASSLEEAVAITRKLTKKSGPLIEREPVTSEDVLALSEEVRSVTEKRLSQKDVPSSRGVTPTATMNTVVGAIRRAGGK